MKVNLLYILSIILLMTNCSEQQKKMELSSFQTSRLGDNFKAQEGVDHKQVEFIIQLESAISYQEILGFGGAFTEASAHLIMGMDSSSREEILALYFSNDQGNYSMMRTHMNSCDFSLSSYAYDTLPNDTDLTHFSIERDQKVLIPLIKASMKASQEGFNIFSSPWTAPPWMKTNGEWFGGELKKEYYQTWANYFVKYLEEYKKEGIDIWGFTVENEPMGNNSNWESMHFTPESMAEFVSNYLGPTFKKHGLSQELYVFDQNKGEELLKWSEVLLKDSILKSFIAGTAVHWYEGTENAFPESLQKTHELAPDKKIIHSEACIDAEIPVWKDDDWYWQKNATDWGWDWAPEEKKKDHPKYSPVHRYANDIIDCMNHQVSAWVDWNIVLNRQGGPNHVKNWCIAPIIVDEESNEYYVTPLYYIMRHFSQFVRPGAIRINWEININQLKCTAFKNIDGSIVLIVFNPTTQQFNGQIQLGDQQKSIHIDGEAIQTIVIK